MKELVEGQNLFDYINSTADKNRVLCEKLIWEIFIQIVLALNYIHVEKGVVVDDSFEGSTLPGINGAVSGPTAARARRSAAV